MSSTTFKNLIQRREHRERAQPAARARYGLLEKHKDYVERSKNYHDKDKRIRALKRRAAMRNPDEFYFGMNSATTKNGVHTKARDVPTLTPEELALFKSQDKSYIQTMVNQERAAIEKLEGSLHGISAAAGARGGADVGGSSRHQKFATEGDDEDGAAAAGAAQEDEPIDACLTAAAATASSAGVKRKRGESDDGKPQSKRRKDDDSEDDEDEDDDSDSEDEISFDLEDDSDDDSEDDDDDDSDSEKKKTGKGKKAGAGAGGDAAPSARHVQKAMESAYRELLQRRDRLAKLEKVLASMTVEAQLRAGKGKRIKVSEATKDKPAVYKWRQERAR